MRWQTAIIAGALALGACEVNDPADPIDVAIADLAGTYALVTMGGDPPGQINEFYCLESALTVGTDGSAEIRHHFIERTAVGVAAPCSTATDREEFDIFWRGDLENTSTLVVMTIDESETVSAAGSSIDTSPQTELVGEFNPQSGRMVLYFPDIWSFNPHGGSGGKISLGGETRGLGGGTMVFDR